MIKGITSEQESIIKSILKPFKDYEFYFYGSRVKGNFEVTSDLDILVKGEKEFPLDKLEMVKILFDNSDLPYIVNFVDYNSIDERFYKLIEKDLVRV